MHWSSLCNQNVSVDIIIIGAIIKIRHTISRGNNNLIAVFLIKLKELCTIILIPAFKQHILLIVTPNQLTNLKNPMFFFSIPFQEIGDYGSALAPQSEKHYYRKEITENV